jgi:hypothetical protein
MCRLVLERKMFRMKAEAGRHEVKAEIKLSLPCRDDIWGSGGTDPSFLTFTLDGGVRSASRPGKEPTVPHWAEGGWAPEAVWR